MTLEEAFETILRDTIKGVKNMDELDILLHAVIVRTHEIALRDEVELEDVRASYKRDGRFVLAALTRWSAASLLAKLWPPTKERGQERYWYDRYARYTPYELFSDVPEALRERALAAKASIAAHPLVAELIVEN